MAKEKFENGSRPSFGDRVKNTLITAAVSAALIAGQTACNTENGNGKDKNAKKKEIVSKPKNDTQVNNAKFQQDETSQQGLESGENSQGRKIVNTEKYNDKYGRIMTKNIYEDGSWSVSLEGQEPTYDYTEYYSNGNKKFEFAKSFYEGFLYAIYNEDGKLLYRDCSYGIRETDSASGEEDKYFKYDEKGRLIEDKVKNVNYEYNDTEKTIIKIQKIGGTAKRLTKYSMYHDINEDYALSDIFVGETGEEIDVIKGGVDELIKRLGMENIPHIYVYRKFINAYIYKG